MVPAMFVLLLLFLFFVIVISLISCDCCQVPSLLDIYIMMYCTAVLCKGSTQMGCADLPSLDMMDYHCSAINILFILRL